jgi:uncharacterized surface protein with fasciclin (FAS1) repeats
MFRPLRTRRFLRVGLVFGLAALAAAAAGRGADAAPATPASPPSIAVWLAPYAGSFDTNNNDFNIATHLVLKFPDLVRAATRPGNSTVFLPSDYAFRAWVKGATGVTVVDEAALFDAVVKLSGANLPHLVRYHIVKNARLDYAHLIALNKKAVVTSDGATFTVRTAPWVGHKVPFVFLTDKALTTLDPKITNGNIGLSNGVIHVIDRLLLPTVK